MSGGGGGSNQSTTAQAPSWQLPYQQYGLNQSQAQYNGVSSPTQLVAPFSPMQNEALTNIQSATNNNPTSGAVNTWVTSTLNGNPANNPSLSSEFNLAANDVQNRLSSEFAGSGRGVVGSLPIQSDEMNNLATQLYGGAYNTGVQEQEQAAATAPSAVSTALSLPETEFNAGGQVQNLAQQYIQAPQNFLNQYLSRVNGNLGTTQTTPMYFNPGMTALGGAGLGSSLASALGYGQTGQGIGGLLGAIGGAFA